MTVHATVPLTQNLAALALANRVRLARQALKASVADGTITAAGVIVDPPACAVTMAVGDLLRAQYNWGALRVTRVLWAAGIDHGKALGSLTVRQRTMLAGML